MKKADKQYDNVSKVLWKGHDKEQSIAEAYDIKIIKDTLRFKVKNIRPGYEKYFKELI